MMADLIYDALSITGFVFLMMLIIEYINVISRGSWFQWFASQKWSQHLVAILLGLLLCRFSVIRTRGVESEAVVL